ncbi:hypothetical protein AMS68_004868 [Peltaster fructicola]|uniref:SEC7 domain-containing protein n=1 Tax=Peltaster fructicola TaxID=286661 RepID=A0A6H0XXG6_9PEZI|nr:hypothetical protein AMS68_004868 [Peltaster fructicola]
MASNGLPRRGYSEPVQVAINPVALVVTECITVTSAMRKHARWAHSSISSILGASVSSARSETRSSNNEQPGQNSKIDVVEDDSALASRWGLRGKKGQSMQDNPLMSAFSRLRADLKHCKDVQSFDTTSLLHPFLQVIRSSSTTAPITSLALIAITKLLAYNIITPSSPNFAHGMYNLAQSVTNCRFEGDNTASDEVVFLRILKLMEDMICGPAGDVLGDKSVCEIVECALSICCHLRMSEVLRRSAEISMVTMCQMIFKRLRALETEHGTEPGALEDTVAAGDMEAAKINSNAQAADNMQQIRSSSLDVPSIIDSTRPSMDATASPLEGPGNTINGHAEFEMKPYGLPSIAELFRVLADLLDPHDRARTDTLRVMALRIVNVALEVAGPSIANHPSLASLAKDTLCRNLFQLVRSENVAILHESLRVAGTLLATCRSVLKLQQELFLSYVVACLHPRVPIPDEPNLDPSLYQGIPQAPALVKPQASATQSGRSTPVPVRDRQRLGMEGGSRKPDSREAMVESVGALVRIPSFMVELFVNYDSDIDRSDLCVDMVGLLARNAFPDSATWSTTNVPPLCLDSLLGFVQFMAERLDDEPAKIGLPDPADLRKRRLRKKVIMKGASKFNENPKGGLAYLANEGIIDDLNNAQSVTKFLKSTARIDKKVLGEFISKKSNDAILEAFLDQFDFKELRMDEALRQMLNTFRLPGESQLIERIVTVFSEKYHAAAQPKEIKDKDAVFVLCYAVIMLNTDAYNRNIKASNRMTLQDFSRNLRGVNGGENFDPQYLEDIYNAIKASEIVLPEEHDNKHAFDHAWKELQTKTENVGQLIICDTNLYDADMFAATWRPILATLNYVFISATEDAVFQRVIAGYNQCSQIATRYGITDCLDQIIWSLSRISTLATEQPPDTSLNTEIQAGGKSIMVSKFAVDFGRDSKAQLATVVLFKIINGNEIAIRDGWSHIVRIVKNLFVNSLIPTSFTSISRDLDLPPIPLQSPAQVIERNDKSNDVGLFSAFTSYVSSVMNDEPPEPNDQEIEATLMTVDCITDCHFEQILGNVSELPVESLTALTLALIESLPVDDEHRVIAPKTDLPAPTPIRANGTKATTDLQVTYDPALVYVLELATILALRDEETLTKLGAEASQALEDRIRDPERLHPVALSRVVFYLLSLLRASNDHGYIKTPVVLHAISSFREDLLVECAQPVLKGIYGCVSGPPELKHEVASSPDFWAILRSLHTQAGAASAAFKITELITSGPTASVTADNYESAIALLNSFATAGSVGARQEQQKDAALRKQQPAATDKKPAKNEATVRGVKAIVLVSQLAGRAPALIKQSHLENNGAWNAYWSPIFRCLATQSTNPCREIRSQALSALQRCLQSPELASPDHKEWTKIFGEVLFPLIAQLLKPEVFQTDALGMSETRIQAAQLLCKIFLHYLVLLSEFEGVLDLWVKILAIMDRLMNSGSNEMLSEAVPESLKNILLVMSSGGYLVPPSDQASSRTPRQKQLWDETWTQLDRFLPDLMPEVFPDAVKQPEISENVKDNGKTEAGESSANGSQADVVPTAESDVD